MTPVHFALLSVITFRSFLREFSPLEIYCGGIQHFLMPRPRVSVDVAGLHREPVRLIELFCNGLIHSLKLHQQRQIFQGQFATHR